MRFRQIMMISLEGLIGRLVYSGKKIHLKRLLLELDNYFTIALFFEPGIYRSMVFITIFH